MSTPRNWPKFREKLVQNCRRVRLRLHATEPFVYEYRKNLKLAVIPKISETKQIYLSNRKYERTELEIVQAWLRPGDAALDCGANVGLFSVLMSQCVGASGRVISLEPGVYASEGLERVLEALSINNVTPLAACVSDKCGTVSFREQSSFSEASAIASEGEQGKCVVALSIDEILNKFSIEPALVKLDIEGAEPMAFRGWETLHRCESPPLLIFEVFPRGLSKLGFTPTDIFDAIPSSIYDYWSINFSWPNLMPEFPIGTPFPMPTPLTHAWPTHSNVIAVPIRGRFARRAKAVFSVLAPKTS